MQLHINTYGAYVHVKDDMFEIRIKKEKEVEKYHYSSKKVTSIIISLGAALSSDAVKLAITNNIDIIFIEYDGMPLGRIWHSKLGSTTKIRKAQLEASFNETGVKYIKEWISAKVQNQIDFIKDLKKHRSNIDEYLDDKIDRLENLNISICNLSGSSVSKIAEQIRGLEGTAGRLDFETISHVLPKDNQFQGRSSRPAKDPFNAFLNYTYGMLYYKIEKSLIIAMKTGL